MDGEMPGNGEAQGSRAILILGADGRVGRQLRRIAGEDPDLLWLGHGQSVPPGLQAGSVLSLWGVTSGTPARLSVNSRLAVQAIELAARVGARRVLHCSSGAVYGRPAGAVAETARLRPSTDYGRAKMDMEQWVDGCRPLGPAQCILRLGNVMGADSLAPALSTGGEVWLDRFADGQGPWRSYLGPRDLLAMVRFLAALPPVQLPAVLNLAGPVPIPMAGLLRAAGCRIRWRPAPPTALPRLVLDTSLLETLAGGLPASGSVAGLLGQLPRLRRAA